MNIVQDPKSGIQKTQNPTSFLNREIVVNKLTDDEICYMVLLLEDSESNNQIKNEELKQNCVIMFVSVSVLI